MSPKRMLVCAARRKEPNAMRMLIVQSAEQTCRSQAANTAKGSGNASLRSRLCCGDAKALTNGFASGAMREWIWPMRASHESAVSIGLSEMRTLVRSSVCEVSQACIKSTTCTNWRSPSETPIECAKARNARMQQRGWGKVLAMLRKRLRDWDAIAVTYMAEQVPTCSKSCFQSATHFAR